MDARRRMLAIPFALALAFGVAACGEDDEPTTGGGDPADGAEGVETQVGPKEGSNGAGAGSAGVGDGDADADGGDGGQTPEAGGGGAGAGSPDIDAGEVTEDGS